MSRSLWRNDVIVEENVARSLRSISIRIVLSPPLYTGACFTKDSTIIRDRNKMKDIYYSKGLDDEKVDFLKTFKR